MSDVKISEDWNAAIHQPIFVHVQQLPVESEEPTRVISAMIKPRRAKVQSFFFGANAVLLPKKEKSPTTQSREIAANVNSSELPVTSEPPTNRPRQHTRLRPPKDVVKLGDRLFFLLQPPLEYLLQDCTLEFPFEPFNYQFAGISFMFTRNAAILA
ncbi:MAG: hypothetical protein ABL888_08700, partial [Pirellulaceae bacterium]